MSLLLYESRGRCVSPEALRPRGDRRAPLAITRLGVAERWTVLAIFSLTGCAATLPQTPALPSDIAVMVGNDGRLHTDHTCLGADHSPMISWDPTSLPERTSHISLRMRSPDGVVWTAWDSPASAGVLHEAVAAASAPPLQGINHRGRVGWAGPCPPKTALGSRMENTVELEVFATSAPVEAPPTAAALEVVTRARALATGYVRLQLELDLR